MVKIVFKEEPGVYSYVEISGDIEKVFLKKLKISKAITKNYATLRELVCKTAPNIRKFMSFEKGSEPYTQALVIKSDNNGIHTWIAEVSNEKVLLAFDNATADAWGNINKIADRICNNHVQFRKLATG